MRSESARVDTASGGRGVRRTTATLYLDGLALKREPWPRTLAGRKRPLALSDDPADHGLSAAEVACIGDACELRRRALRAAIEERWQRPQGGEWLIGGPRPTCLRESVAWILLVPILNLFSIAGKLLEPLGWVSHWRAYRRDRAELREELATLEGPPCLQPVAVKTLGGLWRLYGLATERFGEQACVELLSSWIVRLYGVEMLKAIDLEGRLARISQRRLESRGRSPDLVCVLWIPRLEQVLRELAVELPPYDWAGHGPAGGGRTLH